MKGKNLKIVVIWKNKPKFATLLPKTNKKYIMENNKKQEEQTYRCNDCGNTIYKHEVFCSKCGKLLDKYDFED